MAEIVGSTGNHKDTKEVVSYATRKMPKVSRPSEVTIGVSQLQLNEVNLKKKLIEGVKTKIDDIVSG